MKESGDVPFMRIIVTKNKKHSTNQPSQKRHSLRRFAPSTSKNSSNKQKEHFNSFPIKGISALSFINKKCALQAGMTLEAAIVLPLFLYFFMNLLWVIEIYRLHSTLQTALRETGFQLAVYGYAYDAIMDEEEDKGLEAIVENIAFSELYIRNKVEKLAGEKYLQNSPLTYGKAGLCYLETSVMQQDDIIDLTVGYLVSPFIEVVGFLRSGLYTRYYGRAWTGYDVQTGKETAEKIWVYVAENGIVYHAERECTYISLSIKEVASFNVPQMHNEYGEHYRACELCVTGNGGTVCYVTDCGDCYHQSKNCSGLSRYLYQISYEEAEHKYKKCSRCGR